MSLTRARCWRCPATAAARYTVAAGDTLSAIVAALAVPGGWPALYAANRRVIGPDPALIRPGTILGIPRPRRRPRGRPVRPPGAARTAARAGAGPAAGAAGRRPRPGGGRRPGHAGLADGHARGRGPAHRDGVPHRAGPGDPPPPAAGRRAVTPAGPPGPAGPPARGHPAPRSPPQPASPAARPAPGPPAGCRPAGRTTRIVVADYPRLVVTRSAEDGTVYLLRPPGQDPAAILRVARLVLPEEPYRQLAGQLGLPASWPILLADYDRLVVTCSARDGTVCVLRPPGQDPATVLKAARLVLPEEPYEELAEMLDVPASWPLQRSNPGPRDKLPRDRGTSRGPGVSCSTMRCAPGRKHTLPGCRDRMRRIPAVWQLMPRPGQNAAGPGQLARAGRFPPAGSGHPAGIAAARGSGRPARRR